MEEVTAAAEAGLMTFEKVTGGRSSRSSFQIAWAGAEVTWFRTDSCKILDCHKNANKNRPLKRYNPVKKMSWVRNGSNRSCFLKPHDSLTPPDEFFAV